MKKIYASPISLFLTMQSADVLTASVDLVFSDQIVDVDERDSRSFGYFFE